MTDNNHDHDYHFEGSNDNNIGDSNSNDDNDNDNNNNNNNQGGYKRACRNSWQYDENHHVRQHSIENVLLPINEHEHENDCDCDPYENEHEYEYEHKTSNNTKNGQQDETTTRRQPEQFWRRQRRRRVLGKAWEIPAPSMMRRRRRFRQIVHEETMRHRRILDRDGDDNNDDNNNDNDHCNDENASTRATRGTPKITTGMQQQPNDMQQPNPNVSELLRDREVFGGGNTYSRRRRGIDIRSSTSTSTLRRPRSASGNKYNSSNRNRNTFSGFSTTNSISTFDPGGNDDDDVNANDSVNDMVESSSTMKMKPASPTTVTATDASAANGDGTLGGNSDPAKQKRFRRNNNRSGGTSSITNACHRRTTDQLRTYAEQVCVTKFESSYLTHLMHEEPYDEDDDGDDDEDEDVDDGNDEEATTNDNNGGNTNNNRSANAGANFNADAAASSNAISTISIAFSPDGKTMASTHGDHTVKITCCFTGNLLQTLVGHPRTPWTVKYHPHAGEDCPSNTIIADANSGSGGSRSSSASNNVAGGSGSGSSGASARMNLLNASGRQGSSFQEQQKKLKPQKLNPVSQPQRILASGCLGHQVRIWDWITGTCLQMIRLEFAIISLSFHPCGSLLAIANGTKLHFWSLPTMNNDNSDDNGSGNGNDNNNNSNGRTTSNINQSRSTSMEMRHMLRCVHFLPDGKKVIVGGVNPPSKNEAQRQRRAAEAGHRNFTTPMSFYLRLWDFDLRAAKGLLPIEAESAASAAPPPPVGHIQRRRPISNSRSFVPRALLYNDGGFDVSPDGKTLCACAEYWLPEGVDNATDLLHPLQNDDFEDDDSDSYSDSSIGDETERDNSNNDKNDVKMNDGNSEVAVADENDNYLKDSSGKEQQTVVATDVSVLAETKDASTANDVLPEDSKDDKGGDDSTVNDTSPTRPPPFSSVLPSKTPPRVAVRQQLNLSPSPPIGTSATAGTISSTSLTGGPTTTPIQAGLTPQTPPPNMNPLNFPLSPPSPPGRRFPGGLGSTGGRNTQSSQRQQHIWQNRYSEQQQQQQLGNVQEQRHQQIIPAPQQQRAASSSGAMSRSSGNGDAAIPAPPGINHRNHRQHRLHTQDTTGGLQSYGNPFRTPARNPRTGVARGKGRFVPHVVAISLDTEPYIETTYTTTSGTTTAVAKKTYNIPGKGICAFGATRPHTRDLRPRLGQLLSACPLDGPKASAVTCVKYSPCTEFCLIGYGVRELHVETAVGIDGLDTPQHPPYHPVTAMYKVNTGGRMRHVSTMLSGDDDVNIARFHPESGHGFVYGTKQGRIRILGPRPWNYYNC